MNICDLICKLITSSFFQSFCPSFLATTLGVYIGFWINKQKELAREKNEKIAYLRLLIDSYNSNLQYIIQWGNSINDNAKYALNLYLHDFESTGFHKYQLINNPDLIREMINTYPQLKMMQEKINLQMTSNKKEGDQIRKSMKKNIEILSRSIPIIVTKLEFEIEKISYGKSKIFI